MFFIVCERMDWIVQSPKLSDPMLGPLEISEDNAFVNCQL